MRKGIVNKKNIKTLKKMLTPYRIFDILNEQRRKNVKYEIRMCKKCIK